MATESQSRSPTPSSSSLSADRKGQWSSKNPLSVRLYKILSNSYQDEATREALETLSDLYVTASPTAKPREHRSKGDDAASLWSEGRIGEQRAVDVLGPDAISGEAAARARKHLRQDMEDRLAEGSRLFLSALAKVDYKLEELQTHVDAMRKSCDEAENQLKLTTGASRTLLERAGHLREERQNIEDKKAIVEAFLARFTLNEEEAEAISSRDVPVGQRLFDAMDKTERIRDDCRLLMAGEDGPTTAGLEIMSSTSSYLEQGYEKILRWCTHEFRRSCRDMHIEVRPTMREAVKRLRKRPELLTEALGALAETRQATLQASFITALTRGGPSGLPRPIELHAHDPLRYVGDMLAWVHQAIAAEWEFLESLFDLNGDGRMVGSARIFNNKSEDEELISDLMDSCVEKLCIPLKLRVQQTVRSQESSIVSYKIANLLQFYMQTMTQTIGGKALLSKTLLELTDLSYTVFYNSIEAQGRALLRTPLDMADSSLNPSLAILDHAQILRDIMIVYQSSLVGDEDEEEQISNFQKILDIMVDPAIEMCIVTAEEKRKLRPRWDHVVYILNCLTSLQGVLDPFSFAQRKNSTIQDLINNRIALLTEEHYTNIMKDAGIYGIAEACKHQDRTEPLSRVPTMQPAELQAALRGFSRWLSSLEVVQSHRLAQLTVQRLHMTIHQAALERMARAYKTICDEVRRPENRYEAASTLLGGERPFGQVHLLQQIFGLKEEEADG